MSVESFQLAYDGAGVREGSMDVHELAPALLGIGDLVKEANHVLNGDRASVSVRVESDFKTGSFEIRLILDQNLIEQAKDYLLGNALADAGTLVRVLFGGGTVAVLVGVIKIYKALRGEKIKSITLIDNSTHTTVIHTDSGRTIENVDSDSARLYRSEQIREAVRRVVKPVEEPGIDELQIRKNKDVIERISKEEVHVFIPSEEFANDLTNTREAYLKIVKLSFLPGQSWRFSDGAATFNAKINDGEFQKRLEGRQEGFYCGDRLHVRLKTIQSGNSGKLKSVYSVEKVIAHMPTPRQESLE